MANWKDLSLKDKAEYIRSAVRNGIYNLGDIRKDYETNLQKFANNDANFIERLRSNDTRNVINEDGTVSTHRLGYVTEDNGAVIYPEVQDSLGTLVRGNYNSAVERGDTVRTSIPFADYYTRNYKRDYPEFFNRFANRVSTPTLNYANGGKTQKAHLWGEFDYPETIKPSNNKFERISNDRYNTAYNALRQSGYHGVNADRLAKILASQSITETGWVDKNDTHNYAGYLDSKRNLIKYNSPEDFWKTHISNLSNRWPEWDTANDTNEYFNIINHVDLGLTTKDKFNKYNKKHRNNPVYLYAPDWENTNYSGRMKSVSKRVNKNVPQKIGPVYD